MSYLRSYKGGAIKDFSSRMPNISFVELHFLRYGFPRMFRESFFATEGQNNKQ